MIAMTEVPSTITVNVNQEHINKGQRVSTARCPVALATVAELQVPAKGRLAVRTSLHITTIELITNSLTFSFNYDLNPTVTQFITAFDAGKIVAPFEFDMSLCFSSLYGAQRLRFAGADCARAFTSDYFQRLSHG